MYWFSGIRPCAYGSVRLPDHNVITSGVLPDAKAAWTCAASALRSFGSSVTETLLPGCARLNLAIWASSQARGEEPGVALVSTPPAQSEIVVPFCPAGLARPAALTDAPRRM